MTHSMHSKFTNSGRKFDKKVDNFGFKSKIKVACHFQDRLLIAQLRHLSFSVHFYEIIVFSLFDGFY